MFKFRFHGCLVIEHHTARQLFRRELLLTKTLLKFKNQSVYVSFLLLHLYIMSFKLASATEAKLTVKLGIHCRTLSSNNGYVYLICI